MKKQLLLALFVTVFIAILFIGNCSDPLESLGPESYIDTVFYMDTVKITDTLDNSDTIHFVDTVKSTDTVIIFVTDSSQFQTICSQINSYQKKIVWMFRNQEGDYRLEFSASQDGKKPKQTLHMVIDGHEYRWKPTEDPELIKELHLEQDSTIKITTCSPPARGHPIYICLTLSKL